MNIDDEGSTISLNPESSVSQDDECDVTTIKSFAVALLMFM